MYKSRILRLVKVNSSLLMADRTHRDLYSLDLDISLPFFESSSGYETYISLVKRDPMVS